MARLPIPGQDDGVWGDILNQYLLTSHKDDGTLKDSSISAENLENNSVDETKLDTGGGTDGQVLTKDSTFAGGFKWQTHPSGVTVHGLLTGLDADDHLQYLTNARGDARYYTQAQVDAALSSKADVSSLATVATSGSYTDLSDQPTIPVNLGDLGDVSTAGASDGQVLKYNAGQWTPGPDDGGGGGGETNLSAIFTPTTVTIASDTGSDAVILAANGTDAGVLIAADKTKLDGIEVGAEVNDVTSVAGKTGAVTLVKGDVGLANVDNTSDLNKPVSTATQAEIDAHVDDPTGAHAATAISFNPTGSISATDVQAAIVEVAAEASSSDPTMGGDLTGTASNAQIAAGAIVNADISGSAAIAQSKVANLTTDLAAKIDATEKGAINGVAELDGSAKVPDSQLAHPIIFLADGDPLPAVTDGAVLHIYDPSGTLT